MTEQFIITKEWLESCRTKKGGFTKAQSEILFIEWPFKKGWKKELTGCEISYKRKHDFELANIPNKKQGREVLTIDNCIAYLFKNSDKLNKKQAYNLFKISGLGEDLDI